ncbi:BppU family phage baseplate upper protein [Mammaliicoccus vitulinus]|uniref:BppU family phage baseplate upper protein n=1 Tax=Mammaliicoccus vitulinus TaxID=71237 RepID=UPI0019506607|nr:BppU family phage baseplate upper protein [Mammaliicoccus vitulinus]MBM6630341.1 BppU family phage baseplate upper protein [Mammaliicoccus vitulinus]
MENGINKTGFFNATVEPHLRPISDLGIGFYNLDENTAKLRLQLSNSVGALLISDENLKVYGYFESSNGSVSDVIELNIVDELNGIVEITLDQDFLHASTSTKVKGQLYIGVQNVSGKPEYNEVAVLGEFTFEVADALINKISSFTKVEYIRMFSQLKAQIEKEVQDIQDAIANGADYVAEMNTVKEQGIKAINKTVTEGKDYIDDVITNYQSQVNSAKDSAIAEIDNKVTTSSREVKTTSDTAVTHVDEKMAEFNTALEENGFIDPKALNAKLDSLNWQKYSMVNNEGKAPVVSLGEDSEKLHALQPGYYYTTTTPIVGYGVTSTAGFTEVVEREGGLLKRITFRPYNSGQIWQKRFYNEWSDWERINDNGFRMSIAKGTDIYTLKPGMYEGSELINDPIGDLGYYELTVTESFSGRKVIYAIHSHYNRHFVKTFHTSGVERPWKELTYEQTDTGWIPFQLINGAVSNTEYNGDDSKGFDCAYRIVTNGDVITKTIRLNGRTLTQGQIIAQLPNNLFEYAHSFPVRVPTSSYYSGAYITVRPTGEMRFYINGDSSNWNTTTGYLYGEYTWVE